MINRYYKIERSSDPKVVGVNDGGGQVEISAKGFKDKGGFDKLLKLFSLENYKSGESMHPGFEVAVEYAKAFKRAKLTDFLFYTPHFWTCPFMLSTKGQSIFAKHNLTGHNFYPATIYHKDLVIEDYKLFQCKELDYDVINFPNSKFHSGYEIMNNLKKLKFNSKEDFIKRGYISFFRAEKITLNSNFDISLDFFILGIFGTFVSERMMGRMKEDGLTGMNFVNSVECST